MDMILAGIRAVKASRSVPFFLKKGRRQAFLVQESLQRTNTDDIYWSSSENVNNSNNAFIVNFNNANVNNDNKNNSHRVRAVCAFSKNCNTAVHSYPGNSMDTPVCMVKNGKKIFLPPLVSGCFHFKQFLKNITNRYGIWHCPKNCLYIVTPTGC